MPEGADVYGKKNYENKVFCFSGLRTKNLYNFVMQNSFLNSSKQYI